MATRLKANIAYTPVVEEINRKFVPRKQTCTGQKEVGKQTIESTGWMGGACKTTWRAGIGTAKRNYAVMRVNGRTTVITENEIASRALFTAVTQAVPRLLKDLTQISNIQLLWEQASVDESKELNGVSAYGYTFNGWVFAVQYAGKKENSAYNLLQFPSQFDA